MAGIWPKIKSIRPQLIILLTPLLTLPLPLIVKTSEAKCAYVLILMAVFWISESVPIAVTALLPLFLFPMMGVMPAATTAKSYMSDILILFLGGLMVAVAIERWNLHRRIALRVLMLVGAEPRWLMLGLMLATWFLSMWISNTATTAMMIPITEAILQQLKTAHTGSEGSVDEDDTKDKGKVRNGRADDGDKNDNTFNSQNKEIIVSAEEGMTATKEKEKEDPHIRLMAKGMSLSICYAANSGGIATLTGTGPNLIFKDAIDSLYHEYGQTSPVTFASWMGFGFPLSVLVLLTCWVLLQIAFLRCRGLSTCCVSSEERAARNARVKEIIRSEYIKLGSMTFAEGSVLFWFVTLVLLWITRDLSGVGGWGILFEKDAVKDSTPAIFIGFILFVFPSVLPFMKRKGRYDINNSENTGGLVPPLLSWPVMHSKFPWSLMLLLGGGFALSDGCRASGLSNWIGKQLEVFSGVDKWGMLFIICFIAAAATEVTSNSAIAILFMPILGRLAVNTGVHPLYYMIPGAVSCSFAFMLPVATPPNAIVFSYGHIRIIDMIGTGFIMNILAVPLLVLATGTWGDRLFDFQTLPQGQMNATSLL
ncbi:solute carrier family 13 member 5-like isoform X2 [Pomacea canaliculata]|nr:solute carrier family 13 member 5-like isoform X2 [Pomacea canaliculata]XP_025091734.1 solute carrier family 13 member 5-like isoform X2 [Pomacea canaliculata]